MKWMRAGHSEGSANSAERSAAPYGTWRSERTEKPRSAPQVASQEIDLLPALDEALRNPAKDDRHPVQIPKEGLLG